MRKFYQALIELISQDSMVGELDGSVYGSLQSVSGTTKSRLSRFPIELVPMGFSQMTASGSLDVVHYFCLKIVHDKIKSSSPTKEYDFVTLGERLATLVHGATLEGTTAYLSKDMIVSSSFVLQNSNRRINVTLRENEVGQILFFWAIKSSTAEPSSDSSQSESMSYLPAPSEDDEQTTDSESERLEIFHDYALGELFP